MAVLLDNQTKLVVQGITGSEGKFHTERMLEYGTQVVAGVTPGKGGTEVMGVPVYDSLEGAVKNHEVDGSVIFVPSRFANDAILEAVGNGLDLVVCITEHIPVHQVMVSQHYLANHTTSTLIGPNCPGVISPGLAKAGIMPGEVFEQGRVGIVSRSGTLTYEIAAALTERGLGQSSVVGIGGDQIVGSTFIDIIDLFEADPDTDLIVMVGEIGGNQEEKAAHFIEENVSTPVISYIAGFHAPKGKRMGHAGAIISGEEGTAQAKAKTLEETGVSVARTPDQLGELATEKISA
ncbi:MAG: succinate--CoA ligase subunit alpha [Candidatus Bipolaricaulota bacterium]